MYMVFINMFCIKVKYIASIMYYNIMEIANPVCSIILITYCLLFMQTLYNSTIVCLTSFSLMYNTLCIPVFCT